MKEKLPRTLSTASSGHWCSGCGLPLLAGIWQVWSPGGPRWCLSCANDREPWDDREPWEEER